MTRTSHTVFSILALCTLVATIVLALACISPPVPLPADAPATDFSAGRAMQDLEAIAREPHPVGVSPAHAQVRDYLLDEIRVLGLEPYVQDTFGLRPIRSGSVLGGFVENILVRLRGVDPQGAILLMAHYDSTPGGPGAADNGAGVVTILEILRAVQASPPLRQDLIVFFVDGEEPGTLGAHAFVGQHPWMADVKLVINLDEITDGPATLLRTSTGNGLLGQALARSAPRPASISLPYHLFPGGDTDLTPFVQAGVPGGDFCATRQFTELHTAAERIELVNPASLQHIGQQLLALVRYLGVQPALEISVPDQTLFPFLGRLVHYPTYLALPLALLAGLCFLGTTAFGVLRKELDGRGLGWGVVVLLLSLGLSEAIVNPLWFVIQSLHPEYQVSSARPRLSDDHLYAIGFIVLTLAITTVSIAIMRKRATALNLTAGALLLWFPATIAATILVPATSYLFAWILLSGSIALLLALVAQPMAGAGIISGLGVLISAILATFLWLPIVYFAFLGLGLPSLGILVGVAALWWGSLTPLLDRITKPGRWLLPAAAALAALGCLAVGHVLVGQDSPPPPVNAIGYWLDANAGEAFWIAFSDEPDQRQSELLVKPVRRPYQQLLSQAPPYSVLTSPAPILGLEGPRLHVLADEWAVDRRMVHTRITTSMHDSILVFIPPESPLLAITLPNNGRTELPPVQNRAWMLRFAGMPVEGIEITFEISGTGPIQVMLVEEKTGLPSFPGLSTQPELGTMKSPGGFYQGIPADFTATHRTVVLQETHR